MDNTNENFNALHLLPKGKSFRQRMIKKPMVRVKSGNIYRFYDLHGDEINAIDNFDFDKAIADCLKNLKKNRKTANIGRLSDAPPISIVPKGFKFDFETESCEYDPDPEFKGLKYILENSNSFTATQAGLYGFPSGKLLFDDEKHKTLSGEEMEKKANNMTPSFLKGTFTDNVNHPNHYQTESGLEAIDVIESFELGFCLGNSIKYILRAGKKTTDPLEDLKKAKWYLEKEIRRCNAE